MPALDWIFVCVLVVSLLLGLWRGFVFEVLSVLSWLAAFVLARWFAMDAVHYLPMSGSSESMRFIAGFAVVFVLCLVMGALLAALVKKLVSAVGLSPLDRALGAVFGLVRGVLLLLVATLFAGMSPIKTSPIWQESNGVAVAVTALRGLKPVLPAEFDKFLPV
jgi:membrane protein required for colicin V production